MDSLLEPVGRFTSSILTIFFWIILTLVFVLIAKKIINRILFLSKLRQDLADKNKAILLIKIPQSNKQKE
ncbi:hypothetical protein HYS29_01655, partial [Candidatus Microgenomates bacterium]|nr:hypothetical protein [Candidatus Microgenomates bacterium]